MQVNCTKVNSYVLLSSYERLEKDALTIPTGLDCPKPEPKSWLYSCSQHPHLSLPKLGFWLSMTLHVYNPSFLLKGIFGFLKDF